jgi:hypothetical protein
MFFHHSNIYNKEKNMKSNCINCDLEFNYLPSQRRGVYCSNKCQSEYQIKQRFENGIAWNKRMGIYLKQIRGNRCEVCGITEHNGKPLTFQIDHMNGNRMDNRYENLKVICPNCHTQTDTWGVKNVSDAGKKRMLEGAKLGSLRKNSK